MPIHFPDDLFNDEDKQELALQVFSKLRAKKVVLRENRERITQITPWFAEDDAKVQSVIDDLADCPDADMAKTHTGRVYLTKEFLDNPDVGYTTFGDSE